MQDDLPPITGEYPPPSDADADVRGLSAHEGFNRAWEHALDQAATLWHKAGEPPVQIPVKVEYHARIDIWNPGGIGHYSVTITPN